MVHFMKIFKMQKRMVRIMMGYRNRVSCRSLFKKLEILPLTSQYILLLMLFVIKNKHFFILNTENHTKSTRQLNSLYHPIINLTVYERGVHYMGIRIFNNLPPYINPLKPKLNPICYLLALLGAYHFLHVSRIRVKLLTFRLLMLYIYIYIWSTHS